MDVFELDKQLAIHLERFNNILGDSEVTLREATNLQSKLESEAIEVKYYFEQQTIGLRDAYKKKLDEIEAEHKQDQEAFSAQVQEFNEYYLKATALFEKLEKEKTEFDFMLSQLERMMGKKWAEFEKEASKKLSSLEHRMNSNINSMKEFYDEENAKLIETDGNINMALSSVDKRIDTGEKSFESQIAMIKGSSAELREMHNKLGQFTEALEVKLDNDYKRFEQLITNLGKTQKVGFSITGMFLLLLIVGWFLK